MLASSDQKPMEGPSFIFVGEHPAIDFANTQVIWQGHQEDLLHSWSDLVDWLGRMEMSTEARLKLPATRRADALKSVLQLRLEWEETLKKLLDGSEVSDLFCNRLNTLLAEDVLHEKLEREGQKAFRLIHSSSPLQGEKLALTLLARQIALFLVEANFDYLHRCANTTSCRLYFYDTTKNHRRQWCSIATCGNRHKVAQFRQREARATSPNQ